MIQDISWNSKFIYDFLRWNAVVRKAFWNLSKDDLDLFQKIVDWKLDPKSKEGWKQIKWLLWRCTSNLTPREQIELFKVFRYAKMLKWSDE